MVARIELELTRSLSKVMDLISALELRGFWLEGWLDPTPENVLAQSRRYLAGNPVAVLSLGIYPGEKKITLSGDTTRDSEAMRMTYSGAQDLLSYNDG